jgi:hypothetical protein
MIREPGVGQVKAMKGKQETMIGKRNPVDNKE